MEDDNPPHPLELASMDDLVNEIRRRTVECLIVTSRETKLPTDKYKVSIRWGGTSNGAIGLAEQAKKFLMQ